jgi:hypothetical protein
VSTCTIDGCGRPVEDAYVCQGCTLTLERELGDVRWLDEQLDIVLTKQTSGAPSVGYLKRTESDPALPYDPRATEVRWVLTNTITTWARMVAEQDERAVLPTIGGIGILAAWLASYSGVLRQMDQGEAVDQLTAAIRSARRLVDIRPERVYAGPCDECRQDLYARPGAARITCTGCLATYDAADRRTALLEAARDHLGTVREVVALFGGSVTRDQMKGWIKRGKIGAHGSTVLRGRVVATYRVGDVEDASNAERFDEREQRATRRAGRSA